MPFIGNQPALSYTSFAKQDFTTSATTSYTLDNPVANANELALFINFVRQEPTTAYTASGTSLTLTSATSSTDDMYCVFLGKAVQTVNPPNGSVGTAQLIDGAVTKAKTSDLLYPAFEAYAAAQQTAIADNTWTKVIFDTELFDTNSMYDATTNYRFTPTVSGKYFVYLGFPLQSTTVNSGTVFNISIYKNGSLYKYIANAYNTAESQIYEYVGAVINFNGSTDYVEAFGRVNVSSGTAAFDARITQGIFGAYRIGD